MHKFFFNSFLFPDFKMGVLADPPITHAVPVLLEETDNEDDFIDDGLAQTFNNFDLWVMEELSDDDDDGIPIEEEPVENKEPWELSDDEDELTLLESLKLLQTLQRVLELGPLADTPRPHEVPGTLEESDEEDN